MKRGVRKFMEGSGLRATGKVKTLLPLIKSQKDFDDLFSHLHSSDRLIVMRAADAIEKITGEHWGYLVGHRKELLEFLRNSENKEFKWHLSLLVSRLALSKPELKLVRHKLKT
jgi:hypothetical protein